MTTYEVTISFAKPPSFTTTVMAHTTWAAKIRATREAWNCGYRGTVTKITVKKQEPNA